ncbi:hypothetical protein H5410_020237 [Solanum commersonii]|uniref:Uncharacterized protein n=1 Tax=Solanum commersonii TaxID=4109 RepID=A0A9J5ZBW1_SOLCO|nr:hypothetical protein H5410_020237 [Solanum commersonii]
MILKLYYKNSYLNMSLFSLPIFNPTRLVASIVRSNYQPISFLVAMIEPSIPPHIYGPTWRVLRRNLRTEMLRTTS